MAHFYHYTSRVAAQMAIATGYLHPGSDGVVYLTDDTYATGAAAAQYLGIPVIGPSLSTPVGVAPLTKPMETVCIIPDDRVPGLTHSGAVRAAPFREYSTGRVIYLGGGREFRYPRPIDIAGLMWIALPVP
ncbi:MAG: hypothetical protein HYX51_00375 [Chloroflexi bacterium]|nr:hypothetical protein [Chloroflexota bacterium]